MTDTERQLLLRTFRYGLRRLNVDDDGLGDTHPDDAHTMAVLAHAIKAITPGDTVTDLMTHRLAVLTLAMLSDPSPENIREWLLGRGELLAQRLSDA